MGVDVSAKIVYGFEIDGDEFCRYQAYCDARGEDLSDYFIFLNDYAMDYGGVFGLELKSTEQSTEIAEINVTKEAATAMLKEWHNAFPQRADEQPKFLLVCQWW
jgi:hypothetical protein